MVRRYRFSGVSWIVAAALCMALAPQAQAVNFGEMMNPGKWFGGGNNRDDGPYGSDMPPPGYGAGAPYGYGAPPYGAPAGGYGAVPYGMPPGGGYGQQVPPPGYGQPAAPGYGQPPVAAPAKRDDSEARIEALEQRIRELEAAQQGQRQQMPVAPMPYQRMPPQPGMSGMQGPGVFRPMNQQ